MLSRARARLSFADVVSCLALFVALGGTGYAVTQIDAKSVGKRQLKKNAVVSKKVKNDSLLSKDFKAGQLPAGATGPAGADGLDGATGPAGQTGATGQTGPAGSADQPADVLSKLLTVDGAGSGLDADLFDGITSSAFVADADSADGDVTGPFSNLQLKVGSVGADELAGGAVTVRGLKSGQPTNTFVGHTFDPPSIAAQDCYYKFVTWSEADRGEMVIMSESGNNQLSAGLMLQPTMAREGGVPLALCNFNTSNAVDDSAITVTMTLVGL